MSDPLERLARRAEDDSFFLAQLLACYARSEGLDDGGLARYLGCPPAALTALRLCRAPRPAPREFWDDVRRIGERFGADPDRLAALVRQGQAIRKFQAAAGSRGLLLAARDAPDEGPPEGEP
jgi:hypothetical protein